LHECAQRIYIGFEDPDDVIADLKAALTARLWAKAFTNTIRLAQASNLVPCGRFADRFKGNADSIGFVAPSRHRVSAKAQKGDRDCAASTRVSGRAGRLNGAAYLAVVWQ
jgi:hypothetical protein